MSMSKEPNKFVVFKHRSKTRKKAHRDKIKPASFILFKKYYTTAAAVNLEIHFQEQILNVSRQRKLQSNAMFYLNFPYISP